MNTAGRTAQSGSNGLDLIPFRGVRYVPEQVGSLAAVTSPPYDVVVRPDGLLHLENADPHNIVRLILPQAVEPRTRNELAAATLHRWLAEGVLAPDAEPAFYVYEQRKGDMLQRGIIGALHLSEASEGVVLPHEDVMPHVVEDRAGLMRTTAANLEPLLLTYRGNGNATGATAVIEHTVQRAPLLATTTEDGYSHRLWALTDPADQRRIQDGLATHQALIADGHHRWATYLRLRSEHTSPGRTPWDYGLVLLVDTARYPLQVRAIHRLLGRLPLDRALAAARPHFRVREVTGPLPHAMEALAQASSHGNAFLLTGTEDTYHLLDRPDPAILDRTIPADRPEAWRTLDATVLHSTLLGDVWGIPEDSPADVTYIHDTQATVDKARRDGGTAVLMHPVREEVVRELARQGVTMPRKSTSFGPKPATGLVLRTLTDD
ncbi:DUF1015 domain-containing protein [Streptomyces endophyticus]|uniref:DUF1015 domain-containing protein n=1 Tax=Streptomyces endophyticus TaxID=714166 RepID=A0ABU6EYC6_9ACTN|nr:DUF1015 domain-containing protein [Streptomyces endophyticus]MEB8336758.1 DUF1015 domain-containing protein [Streptomyces endophyticus]